MDLREGRRSRGMEAREGRGVMLCVFWDSGSAFVGTRAGAGVVEVGMSMPARRAAVDAIVLVEMCEGEAVDAGAFL